MSDYISRESAIEALKSIMFDRWVECGEYVGEEQVQIKTINADKAIEAIGSLPAADVRPVVHGK